MGRKKEKKIVTETPCSKCKVSVDMKRVRRMKHVRKENDEDETRKERG